ncbi:MAG TPA: CDP-alcohol phosphatidyltransferase family protein [Isosphaeraceae bacterium]|nr:CDP-alcohol phosphatidyltransferase family protein [Isosphaeraceae bacterium]
MTPPQPTLAELRARVQKGRHREIGNWLARRVARPTAVYGCWLAVRLGLSAHQVTAAAWLASLAAAAAIGTGDRVGFVLGVLLAHLAFWLDHVDGQVARWRGTASLEGVYLDYLMHHAANLALAFALGYGLAVRSGDLRWTIAGLALGTGWTLLSLHNDCRYKAFFQRLKSTTLSYRIDGGSGGRPRPPAAWPRRGWAVLSWPAYKACEPHVVLLGLTGLAGLAIATPALWLALWPAGVWTLAILAPVLGIARIARAVARATVEGEFARWFQPLDQRSAAPPTAAFPPAAPWTSPLPDCINDG